jgi:hypothetical protein
MSQTAVARWLSDLSKVLWRSGRNKVDATGKESDPQKTMARGVGENPTRPMSEGITVNDKTHDGGEKEKEKKKTAEGEGRMNETKLTELRRRQDERRGFLGVRGARTGL